MADGQLTWRNVAQRATTGNGGEHGRTASELHTWKSVNQERVKVPNFSSSTLPKRVAPSTAKMHMVMRTINLRADPPASHLLNVASSHATGSHGFRNATQQPQQPNSRSGWVAFRPRGARHVSNGVWRAQQGAGRHMALSTGMMEAVRDLTIRRNDLKRLKRRTCRPARAVGNRWNCWE